MKMVQAVVRPEKVKNVEVALEKKGFLSLTEISVRGRGTQKGIVIGKMVYDKLPKELILVACKDEDVNTVVETITKAARTGNIGDGKIFISKLDEVVTIRTGKRGRDSL